MPAAAVIPAPIAYIKVVAVKKLVVGFRTVRGWSAARRVLISAVFPPEDLACFRVRQEFGAVTLKKLECLKQAYAMNTLAWNNNLGLRFYFVGF